MPHLSRPFVVVTAIGVLSLLTAGCSSQDDRAPSASPTRSASASANPTATGSVPSDGSSSPSDTPTGATGGSDDDQPDDSAGGVVPTAIPGSGQTGPSDPGGYLPATAVVTYADWDAGAKRVQTAGLVTGTADASGRCTFTASTGTTTKTATSSANGSASSVSCAEASLALTSGTWSIVLTYAIGSDSTASAAASVVVP